jgi:hypothetical protein
MKKNVKDGEGRVRGPYYNLLHSSLARIGTCCCLVVLISWTSALSFGQNKPFTNDDILKMIKAGFSEETILEAIRTNEPHFDTSADGLLTLKNAGVSEKIITAMLTAARPKTGAPVAPGETSALPDEIGVYVFKDGQYTELTVEIVDWRSKFFNPTTTVGNLAKSRLTARLNTPASSLQLSGKTELLIVCPDGVSAMEYHLLRATQSKDKREFRVDFRVLSSGVLLALGGTDKSAVRFDVKKVAAGKFRVALSSLEKGEYGVLPPGTTTQSGASSVGKMYTFGMR